jgi:hypothetical protein
MLNIKDSDGHTPWFTFSAISYLKEILKRNTKVFEYGAGNSTIFFNNNVDECYSVDHNPGWVSTVLSSNPTAKIIGCDENNIPIDSAVELVEKFRQESFELPVHANKLHNVEHGLLNFEYANYASQLTRWEKGYYDLIIVDGMARSLSGYIAAHMISDTGYIVLDNSDRWQYNSLQQYLIDQGFGRLDFAGMGAINPWPWCTSFFSKTVETNNQIIQRAPKSGDLGW